MVHSQRGVGFLYHEILPLGREHIDAARPPAVEPSYNIHRKNISSSKAPSLTSGE